MTFSWTPEFGASGDTTFDVAVIKYGDGYEQRQAKGINTAKDSWPVQFANRDKTEAAAIYAFLKARGGLEAFLWTPPFETVARVWKCDTFNRAPGKGQMMTISATFTEVFEP